LIEVPTRIGFSYECGSIGRMLMPNKNYLVYVCHNQKAVQSELRELKITYIDECFPRRNAKEFAVIVGDEELRILQSKYTIRIEGELNELTARLQRMVGSGNRFDKGILEAKIL
jgi:hypothetical protein